MTALFCILLKCYKIQDNRTQAVMPTRPAGPRGPPPEAWRAGVAEPAPPVRFFTGEGASNPPAFVTQDSRL